jgi:hypothetical protein
MNENGIGTSGGLLSKLLVALVLLAVSIVCSLVLLKLEITPLVAYVVPVACVFLIAFIRYPKAYACIVFIISFLIAGLGRYVAGFKAGIFVDICFLLLIFSLTFNTLLSRVSWRNTRNPATLLTFIWLLYCLFELLNPRANSSAAWFSAVRWMAVYLFFTILIIPVVVSKIKNLKVFVNCFCVLAAAMVLWILKQKYIGLDSYEYTWLNSPLERPFHVLPWGIRYWSFLTDAANAAVCFALAGSFFGTLIFFTDSKKERFWFIVISVACFISSLFTGTRSHMVIPFISLIFLVICSKNGKLMSWAAISLVLIFVFFKYTTIGNSNKYIWRVRTTFSYNQDASYLLRKSNHEKIRAYMADKPFGIGIGLAEWKGLRFDPNLEIGKIPTDSWLYTVFEETGIVGLTLYLLMFTAFIGYGVYVSLFKLKNRFIRGVTIASTGCIAGILVASYGNEVLAQFPNGTLTFIMIGLIFSAPMLDKEIEAQDIVKS